MSEVIILILKIIAIFMISMFWGYKTGIFSLGRFPLLILLLFFSGLFSLEIYTAFFRDDISLKIIFNSSLWNFTLDLSFFIRVFLFTILMGIVCNLLGVRPSVKLKGVKDICVLAILIAITVLLSVYGTIRIGAGIKISFKFISVFITAALFGPLWGGIVGALSDVVAFVINPVGGIFMPQITLLEFLYGFTYGLFFFNMNTWQGFKTMVKVVVCVIFHILILNMGLTTYFLTPLMKMSFKNLLIMRSVSAVINMAMQLISLTFMSKYILAFRKIIR